MVKHITPIVCMLIVVVDIVAGVLSIEAEISQNKVMHLGAVVLLSLAHTFATLLGGCVCVWSKDDLDKSSANKRLAVASLIISWIIFVLGFSLLIIGTLANSKSRKSCGISHHHFLSVGGILCFIHGVSVVAYYASAIAVTREQDKLNQQGNSGTP